MSQTTSEIPVIIEPEFSVSARAAKRIHELLAGEPAGSMLKVSVNGGGCSGFSYGFDVGQDSAGDDIIVVRDGVSVAVDSISIAYMRGAEVDFVDDLMGQSFRVNNPMATSGCGCGTSFSI
jgi:iron-sulfur cluster assembly accessory protein